MKAGFVSARGLPLDKEGNLIVKNFFVARDLWPSFSTAMNLLRYEGDFGPDYVSPIKVEYIMEIREELMCIGEYVENK